MSYEISRPYAAGYFDAEGCIRVERQTKSNTWALRVSFGQTDATVIKMLAQKYGGSLYDHVPKKPHDKAVTRWVLTKERDVRKFLRDVLSHLREKREQVEHALREPLGAPLAKKLTQLKQRPIVDGDVPNEILSKPREKRACSMDDCNRRHRARGLCNPHYLQARNNGSLQTTPKGDGRPYCRRRRPSLAEKQYIAGFFDGDGCLSTVKRDGRWIVSFGQCRPEGVLLLQMIYGGVTQLKIPGGTRRPQLTWAMHAREAVRAFLDDVSMFVIEKHNEVRRVLSDL